MPNKNGTNKFIIGISSALLVVLAGAWILWVSSSVAQIDVIQSIGAQRFEIIQKDLAEINVKLDKLTPG